MDTASVDRKKKKVGSMVGKKLWTDSTQKNLKTRAESSVVMIREYFHMNPKINNYRLFGRSKMKMSQQKTFILEVCQKRGSRHLSQYSNHYSTITGNVTPDWFTTICLPEVIPEHRNPTSNDETSSST